MSNIKHRDVDITVDEGPRFVDPSGGVVDGKGKLVHKAGSKYGNSYAPKPQDAVDGAKKQIDEALDKK
jgi:hypothetical protein